MMCVAQLLLHRPEQQRMAGSGHGDCYEGQKNRKKHRQHASVFSRTRMIGNSGGSVWHVMVCNLTLIRAGNTHFRNRPLRRFLHRERLPNVASPGGAEHIHQVPQAVYIAIFHLLQYTDLQKFLICNCCGSYENMPFFVTFRKALANNPGTAGMQGLQVRK